MFHSYGYHTCQLSQIIRKSPGYDTDLPLSRTGHHISRIKSSFKLFCALVWDLAHFWLKTWIFLIRSTVSGAFSLVFSHWQRLFLVSKRWLRILIVWHSCKTSYNVLSHSHWRLGQFCRLGGRVVKKRESPDFRSPEVGISGIAIYRDEFRRMNCSLN